MYFCDTKRLMTRDLSVQRLMVQVLSVQRLMTKDLSVQSPSFTPKHRSAIFSTKPLFTQTPINPVSSNPVHRTPLIGVNPVLLHCCRGVKAASLEFSTRD